MTVTERLKNIRERVEAATAGPWELIGGGEYVTGAAILVAPDDGGVTGNDAEFIAHARTDLPRLLDAVERVLEVHKQDDDMSLFCHACDDYWPCPTVAAINDALEGK